MPSLEVRKTSVPPLAKLLSELRLLSVRGAGGVMLAPLLSSGWVFDTWAAMELGKYASWEKRYATGATSGQFRDVPLLGRFLNAYHIDGHSLAHRVSVVSLWAMQRRSRPMSTGMAGKNTTLSINKEWSVMSDEKLVDSKGHWSVLGEESHHHAAVVMGHTTQL
jgi:hypothetical protein